MRMRSISYSQRTAFCIHLSQALHNPAKFPEGRAKLFGRGAEYLSDLAKVDGFVARKEHQDFPLEALTDYGILHKLDTEMYWRTVGNLPAWSEMLRTNTFPEDQAQVMAEVFDALAEQYGKKMMDGGYRMGSVAGVMPRPAA